MITIKDPKSYYEVNYRGNKPDNHRILTSTAEGEPALADVDKGEIMQTLPNSPIDKFVWSKRHTLDSIPEKIDKANKQEIAYMKAMGQEITSEQLAAYATQVDNAKQLRKQGLVGSPADLVKDGIKAQDRLLKKELMGHLSKEDKSAQKHLYGTNLVPTMQMVESGFAILDTKPEDFAQKMQEQKAAKLEEQKQLFAQMQNIGQGDETEMQHNPQEEMQETGEVQQAQRGGYVGKYQYSGQMQKVKNKVAEVHLNGKTYIVDDPAQLQARFPNDKQMQDASGHYFYNNPSSPGNFTYKTKDGQSFSFPGTPVKRQSDGSYRLAFLDKPDTVETVTHAFDPSATKAWGNAYIDNMLKPAQQETTIPQGPPPKGYTHAGPFNKNNVAPTGASSRNYAALQATNPGLPNNGGSTGNTGTFAGGSGEAFNPMTGKPPVAADVEPTESNTRFDGININDYDLDTRGYQRKQELLLGLSSLPYLRNEKVQGYYDTTPNTRIQYNEDPYIRENRDMLSSYMENMRSMSPNMNRAIGANQYANTMNANTDVRMKLAEANNSLNTQWQDRERQRNQTNNAMMMQVDDLNARNRAATREQYSSMFGKLGEMDTYKMKTKQALLDRKLNMDILSRMYPVVSKGLIKKSTT